MPLPGAVDQPSDSPAQPVGAVSASGLTMLAAVITLMAAFASARTWLVHRPPLVEKVAAAETQLAEADQALVAAVQDSGSDGDIGDAAAQLGWNPVTAERWNRDFLDHVNTIIRLDRERSRLDGYGPLAALFGRLLDPDESRRWDELDRATRETLAESHGHTEASWNTFVESMGSDRTERSRAMQGLEDLGSRDAIRRIVALVAAAPTTARGGVPARLDDFAILTEPQYTEVRDLVRSRDEASQLLGRLPRQLLAMVALILAVWLLVRRDQRRLARLQAEHAVGPLGREQPSASVDASGFAMLVAAGGIMLAGRLLIQSGVPGSIEWAPASIVMLHVAAAAFVPWRDLKASAAAPVLLVLLWDVLFLMPGVVDGMNLVDRVVVAIVSPIILAPGIAVAEWRIRARVDRAERAALDRRVAFADDELSRARIVHDAMFPDPVDGIVGFDYHYEPIHEIGGDYVHVHCDEKTGRMVVTLLDVAGHGLAAALTVNRLFGELERILAEDSDASPSQIMDLLNRYIHLTMSRHSLFATGTCMSVDPRDGEIRWVSAGHPPSMVRRHDGRVEDLETTTILLGALPPGDFESIEERSPLGPGDVVIAYTDGAFEARDPEGCQFGIDAIRRLVEFDTPPRSWSRFIAHAVESHHRGRAEDDVLIATLALRGISIGGT